jgi:PAS domain S-box-containing protein
MTPTADTPGFLANGGKMGARIRTHNWDATSLGPPESWPQSLKIVVRIMLTSRYAMWMAWGPDLVFFCNDAYLPTLGVKGEWALGASARKVWAEIWPDIGPRIDHVLETGVATWDENLLLFLERSGFPEETYHTFSYSPVSGDDGAITGMLCVVTEETERRIGERRLALLSELGAALAASNAHDEICAALERCLGAGQEDLPITLTYLFDADADLARLACATGIEIGHPAAPEVIELAEADAPWSARAILTHAAPVMVGDLSTIFAAPLPTGNWNKPPRQAIVRPIASQGQERPAGFLVAAINPYRPFDAEYASFVELLAGQIASAMANARAYEAERTRAEALAEIDRAKTAFFSNVSHEFRTPLTLMLGPLEESLANADRLSPEERERVRVVHRNGLRLLKLVNSLLDFSRIEAGRAQASFVPTDLSALTAELASNFRSACEKAGLGLVVDCEPLPEPVYIDRDMWEKVALNLLSNAFKFTFEGEIGVELRACGGTAEFIVRDTGVGIPDHEVPRLFERFHQVEGTRGRSFEGSGIGLALVQELVKLHGGTIRVESEVGRGTTFVVSIPFGTAHLPEDRIGAERALTSTAVRAHAYVEETLSWLPDEPSAEETIEKLAAEADPEPLAAGEGERARLLLADDNADMRDYVRRLLGGLHEVEAVPDGQAALEAVRARRPDLVLTDVMMPRLDGFGLLRAIRDDPDLNDLPVIMLSARAGEEASIEGRSAGADDYLVKPFSARELIARVHTALTMARLRREHTESLQRLNEVLAERVVQRTVERDRIWHFSNELMAVAGTDGYLKEVNPAWSRVLGYDEAVLLSRPVLEFIHPDDRAVAGDVLAMLGRGENVARFEDRLACADGSYRWIAWTAAADGNVFHAIGRDVTEEREAAEQLAKAEAQLRHAQRMEAIGTLTGGVAHDFNNLLQVISSNLQLLSRDVAGNERAEQRLRNALAGVSRGSKLSSQLLAFGRRQPLAPKVVNLGRLVRGLDDMLRRALGEAVEVETIIAGGLWNTFVDVAQVENALLNLAINARDAMEGRGKLTIEAGNASLDAAYAARHAEVTPGQYVMLAVTDTGCGIPPDIIEHVFDPFFTTKPEGQGTGLGLSMVFGFVKQSEGHIKIYSEPGQGTTIRIYLPRTRQEEDIATDVETGPVTGGTETVLVVEDDEDVRVAAIEMLSDLGYRVLRAKDAQSALAIVESGVPIDVLFTDVVMPGPLRSPELARKARERLPNIAVLFTSGYTDNAIVHGGRLDDGIELLSKPYAREALARKLRHILRNQQQRAIPPATPPAEPKPVARPVSADRLRVLLVEDDALIRMSAADILGNLGHSVIEAADANEALAFLEAHDVDVMLTDIGLPGMSGSELAARAGERIPGLRIVFASGRDELPGAAGADQFARPILLRKPYGPDELAEAITAAMLAS